MGAVYLLFSDLGLNFFVLVDSAFLFIAFHEPFLHGVSHLLCAGRRVLASYAGHAEFVFSFTGGFH